MKKFIAIILSFSLILCSCKSLNVSEEVNNSFPTTIQNDFEEGCIGNDTNEATEPYEIEDVDNNGITESFTKTDNYSSEEEIPIIAEDSENEIEDERIIPEVFGLDDQNLLNYISDEILIEMESSFSSDDYQVESVQAIYYSKEYIEELEYNSKKNIYFGYSLEDVYSQFGEKKFVFTLGDDGKTIVTEFEDYDDTFDRIIKNVAIGTGVILICVVVSVVSAGVGASAVSMIFAASAKTGTIMALQSATMGGIASGVVKGIETGDFNEALKAAALGASESYKWGAISGVVIGGVSEAITIRSNGNGEDLLIGGKRTWRDSEKEALKKYPGEEQVSFLNKERVPYATDNSTRPDILRQIDNTWEAIEVKNYDLEHDLKIYSTLKEQIAYRVENLPDDYLQRIIIDVHGRGYTEAFLNTVRQKIQDALMGIYDNIPVEFMY